jgi:hypothetical protein
MGTFKKYNKKYISYDTNRKFLIIPRESEFRLNISLLSLDKKKWDEITNAFNYVKDLKVTKFILLKNY